jgi:hypothetical protein
MTEASTTRQPLDTSHPQFRIDDSRLVHTHGTRPCRGIQRFGVSPEAVAPPLLGLRDRRRADRMRDDTGERFGPYDLHRPPHPPRQRGDVGLRREIGGSITGGAGGSFDASLMVPRDSGCNRTTPTV